MRSKITMEMSICQAENGFSLDELVKKFADAFENKAFAEILKMNLQLTQEVLMYRIFNNSSSQKCCPDGHLTLNGSFERRIRTSLGEFKMDFWRVRCSMCGKTFAPLAKFIGLERYQTKSNELEKLVMIISLKLLNKFTSVCSQEFHIQNKINFLGKNLRLSCCLVCMIRIPQ